MTAFLEQADIRLLSDEYAVIDNRLILAGRLDGSPIGGYGEQKRRELSDFLVSQDPSLPVIVLDHNPAHVHSYGKEADLILCGHTHKGQLFPANFITNAMYAVDYGYYQKDPQSPHVIVTSGVGYWGMPMRVGTDCEIVTIHLTCHN
jgi:predicted MPP superfamily phosphohydrolase